MGRTCHSTGGPEYRKKSLSAVVEGRRQKGRPKLRWEMEWRGMPRSWGKDNGRVPQEKRTDG